MSGPQFIHIETYAMSVSSLRRDREVARAAEGKVVDRKLTVEEICGEAARTPGHHPHIEAPEAPQLLMGVSPDRVPGLIKERIDLANKDIREQKRSMERGSRSGGPRAIRKDTHVLFTAVSSYPVPWRDDGTGRRSLQDPDEMELYLQWRENNVEYFAQMGTQLGFEPLSMVEHSDEEYPHLHGLGVALNGRLDARSVHPGYAARDALVIEPGETDKAFRKRRDQTYKSTMRAFQDDYHAHVGQDSGLTRVGPSRRRLPRSAWLEEKSQAKALGTANLRAKKAIAEAEVAASKAREAYDRTARADAATTRSEARRKEADVHWAVANDALWAANATIAERAEELANLDQQKDKATKSLFDVDGARRLLQASLAEMAVESGILNQKINEQADELAAAKREVEEAHEKLARERSQFDLELKALNDSRREFDIEREASRKKEAAANLRMERERLEVEDLRLGIKAFAEGRLLYRPGGEQEFALPETKQGVDEVLLERMKRVRPLLKPVIDPIFRALEKRRAALESALLSGLAGWEAMKLVVRRDDVTHLTRLEFACDRTDPLRKLITPHRAAVTSLLSALPDRQMLADMREAMVALQPLMSAEQHQAWLTLQTAYQKIGKSPGR